MTNTERKTAFALRLGGESWEEIGRKLSYEESTVRQDLERCLHRGGRTVQTVYPVLGRFIDRNCGGSIRAFAQDCGLSPRLLYDVLPGRKTMSAYCLGRIAEATGLSDREIRQREVG